MFFSFLYFLSAGVARADVFNMPEGLTSLEMVTVGNPGNDNDPETGYGRVDYSYQIGKYEITAGQYTAFLNAVAKTDTYGLYNPDMGDVSSSIGYGPDISKHGCNIKREGISGDYVYSVAADWANRPVNWVSWGDAVRFANWLSNGQPIGNQDLSTTEDGSYYLNGAITREALMAVMRKSEATWVIPSDNEWYKAAYYDPNKTGGPGYWDYPTGTDDVPSNALINPDPGNNANFYIGYYTIERPYWRTEVGEFENTESHYGTFDQCGNVLEWDEKISHDYSARGARGGSCGSDPFFFQASMGPALSAPMYEIAGLGFRVAKVPEPYSFILLGTTFICLLAANYMSKFIRKLSNRVRHLPGFYS
jgi:formylglycine-generating enzyme